MVDEFRTIRDNVIKAVLAGISHSDEKGGVLDAAAARDLVATIFAKAGKSKDEIVQIIAREIGVAVAAVLKEPLAQLAQNRRLQVTFEFLPKESSSRRKGSARKKTSSKRRKAGR